MPNEEDNQPAAASSVAELGWRLRSVESRLSELSTLLNEHYGRIENQISSLSFVRQDVYIADQKVQAERDKALHERTEAARMLAQWALGIIVTTVIGAIVVSVLAAGGIFK